MRRRKVPRGTRVLFFICCIAILIVVPGVYFWRRRECSETKEIFVRATVAIAVIAGSFAYFMAGVAPALFWTVPVGGILGARTARFFLKKMTGPSTGLAWLDLATHGVTWRDETRQDVFFPSRNHRRSSSCLVGWVEVDGPSHLPAPPLPAKGVCR